MLTAQCALVPSGRSGWAGRRGCSARDEHFEEQSGVEEEQEMLDTPEESGASFLLLCDQFATVQMQTRTAR